MANDLHYKISADAQTFTKEMKKVEKTTLDVNKAAQEAAKKSQDAEKLTLKEIRERAREEARLGREAEKIYESTRTAAEKYQKQVSDLKKHLAEGRISQDTFNRSMKNAGNEFKKAGGSLSATSQVTTHFKSSIAALVSPVGLATAALGALALGAKASYDSFQNLEKVDKDLGLVLENVGRSVDSVSSSLAMISKDVGVTTTEIKSVFAELVHASGNVAQSERDLALAYDLAAKASVPAATAAAAINEARQGNISALYQLKLLSAQELKDLEGIEDPAMKGAKALEKLKEENEGLAEENKKNSGHFSEVSNDLKIFSEHVGRGISALGGLIATGIKMTPLFYVFSTGVKGWNSAIENFSVKLGFAKLQIEEFEEQIIKIEGTARKSELRTMEGARERLEAEKALLEQRKLEAAMKKKADDLAAQQAGKLRREEQERSAIRSEMLRFDLDLLAQTNDLDREKIRLLKEEFQIKTSIKNEEEQQLALQLAQEQSAQRQLEIQRKGWNEAEKAWDREQAEARKKTESELNELLRLRESTLTSLKGPQDLLNEQLAEYDRLLQANLITLAEHTELTKRAREESEKRAREETEKISSEMQSLIDMSTFAGQSIMDGFSDLLFDPFNTNLEDMVGNFAKAMGRMALEALAFQAISAATGGAGGTIGDLFGSLFSGAVKKADGGYISGPGTGTSDSIPAFLSNGEFVIPAKSTSYYGLDYLEDLRKMRVPKHRRYAEGGLVTASGNKPSGGVQAAQGGSGTSVDLTIINPRTQEEIVQAMASTAGKKVILNTYLENRKTLKL